jgi:hypothetical protein
VGNETLFADGPAGRSSGHCLIRFCHWPPWGPVAKQPQPTTFLSFMEDRKCEKLWTQPGHNQRINTAQRTVSSTLRRKKRLQTHKTHGGCEIFNKLLGGQVNYSTL